MTAISIMSALAQPTRLEVFTILARAGDAGIMAGDLAKVTGAAHNTMSAHLAILSRAGLVTAEKAGRQMIYRAVPNTVAKLANFLLSLAGENTAT